MTNVSVQKPLNAVQQMKKIEKQLIQVQETIDFDTGVFWDKLEEPLLGKCYQMPSFCDSVEEIDLKKSVSYVSDDFNLLYLEK